MKQSGTLCETGGVVTVEVPPFAPAGFGISGRRAVISSARTLLPKKIGPLMKLELALSGFLAVIDFLAGDVVATRSA